MPVAGSGTVVPPSGVKVASSITNDPPPGSPRMVTRDIPEEAATSNSSFGLLPGSPEIARFEPNAEFAESMATLDELKPVTVNGTRYVK